MGIRLDHDTKCDITMRIPLIREKYGNTFCGLKMGIRLDHDTKCDITMRIPLIKSNQIAKIPNLRVKEEML